MPMADENEQPVDDGLPHHTGLGVVGGAPGAAQIAGLDEGAQQVDRGDADDRHRQLDLRARWR